MTNGRDVSYGIGCFPPAAEPVQVREAGRWSDIMAAPLDDEDPLEPEGEEQPD